MQSILLERYTEAIEKVQEAGRLFELLSIALSAHRGRLLSDARTSGRARIEPMDKPMDKAIAMLDLQKILADGIARGDVTFPQPSSAQGTIGTSNHTTDINKDLVTHGKKAERGSGQ